MGRARARRRRRMGRFPAHWRHRLLTHLHLRSDAPDHGGLHRYSLLLASAHLTSSLLHFADSQDAPRPHPGSLHSSSLPRPRLTPLSLLAAWPAQRCSSSDYSSTACARLRGVCGAHKPQAARWPAARAAQRTGRERVAVALPHSQGRVRATLAGAAARLADGAGAAGRVCVFSRLALWRARGDARGAALGCAEGRAGARGCACACCCVR